MRKADPFNWLKPVYTMAPLSRGALAEMTKVTPSRISVVIRQALNRGLLVERGFTPSKGGRPRILLQANPDFAKLIGIDIGRFHIRFVITDFVGKVLNYDWLPTEPSKGKNHLLLVVHEKLKSQLAQCPEIAAIGISHSGVIDPHAGKVLFWPMVEGWEEIPLRQIFKDTHGLPTFVEDSVRAVAIAEQRFGHAKGLRNFLLVSVGWGIGSAIFIDGRLYIGRDGLAGELGHTTVGENSERCSCGNQGCLELLSSASAIVRRVRSELERGVDSSLKREIGKTLDQLSVEVIVAAAKSGDRLSERILSEAGTHLGTALASAVNFINPEKVILAGKVPQAAGEILLNPLLYSLRHRALRHAVKDLAVVVSQFGEEAAAVGMALVAGEGVLKARCQDIEIGQQITLRQHSMTEAPVRQTLADQPPLIPKYERRSRIQKGPASLSVHHAVPPEKNIPNSHSAK
jgi:N-acetylglucosamine repressor